ncbi:MAG: HAMP domain-containing sensor histidine kinase [bacterium]
MFWKAKDRDIPPVPSEEAPPTDEPSPGATKERTVTRLPTFGEGPAGELSLLSMLELSNELSARMDLYEIAEVTLFNLMGHFACSRAALWVLPEEGEDAVLLRAQGFSPKVARAVGTVWSRWLFDRPGGSLDPVLMHELKDTSAPGLSLAEDAGIVVLAPVAARRRRLGLLALGRRVSGAAFSARDLEVLAASLNFVGASLENTALYNRAIETNRGLRQANERLLELDRLKSEFLRTLNHELRTPLTVIGAYLDSLLMSEKEEGPRKHQLRTVRDESSKLEGMLLNLLDFGKLMGDDLQLSLERGDVTNPLRVWYEERRPGITAGFRELQFSHASSVPAAFFERRRLVQIVDALVGNAVKFCPAGSKIVVRVEPETHEDKDWVRVDVIDDGPGIAPDRLPHIFDSFRQGDGSETRRHGGMGMGLAFARRLAEKMNGTLDVKTELGSGTTFSLRLPLA